MGRDGYHKTKLNAWFQKRRNSRQRTTPTEIVLKPRTVLRTTVIHSRDPSVVTKLHRKWILLTRPLWKARLKKQSAGSTATPQQRRKSMKRSKRNSKALPCLSSKRWEVQLVQVVCLTWELLQVVLLLLPNLQEDLPSKKLIKSKR